MTLVTSAVIFAARAHDGATRRGGRVPYIVHPMEVAAIAASLSGDGEVIAAAALHDVMEDCAVSREELVAAFGERVAALVESQTQTQGGDPRESWLPRKREAVEKLARGGREERVLALSDKLSNMRAIRRDYAHLGERLFDRFHVRDKGLHAWYYRACADLIGQELSDTDAHRELMSLIDEVFGASGEI